MGTLIFLFNHICWNIDALFYIPFFKSCYLLRFPEIDADGFAVVVPIFCIHIDIFRNSIIIKPSRYREKALSISGISIATQIEGGIAIVEHPAFIDYSTHPHFFNHREYDSVNFSLFRKN